MTDAERSVWRILRGRQLVGKKFYRQYSVGRYILDFYCPAIRLAIEIDGGQHNDDANRILDEERTKYLLTHGIRVIRFWNNDVLTNIEGVGDSILSNVADPSAPIVVEQA